MTYTATEANEIGETIWKQISVPAKMSVGARNGVAGNLKAELNEGLFNYQLHFNVNRGNSMKVLVSLNDMDTYDIRLIKISKKGLVTVLESFDGIYNSDLSEIIRISMDK